jgi:modulator of FtsH protease HflC
VRSHRREVGNETGFFRRYPRSLIVAALIVGYSSLFTVYHTQQALVVRLGQPVRVVNEPGLNFKAPFIDSIVYLDKRILDLESPSQEVIASDQKRLVVDAFARYRIQDALRFYQTLGSIAGANSQLSILLRTRISSRSIVRCRPTSTA